MAERAGVAIARAMCDAESQARVVVLDEPTAAMSTKEAAVLFEVLRKLRDRGIAILLVSHHLDEVFDVCDTVTVLRDGRKVITRTLQGLTRSELLELLVGNSGEVALTKRQAPSKAETACFEVHDLHTRGIQDFGVSICDGEIVGVAGLDGSGREVLLPALFGATGRRGTVSIRGSKLAPQRPDHSVRMGVGYLSNDREQTAVLHDMSIQENLTIASLITSLSGLVLDKGKERQEAQGWIQKLSIKPPRASVPLRSCSGGNQQKVLLARWLRLQPAVLLANEPTQGVDIPSRRAVHDVIRHAAEEGTAFLICTTDTEELVELCDRVLVMRDGRIVAELAGGELTPHKIDTLCMIGSTE
jgi:ribose transport system ATP-binding protein